MQYEDFIAHYSRLFVCRMYADSVGDVYFRYMLHVRPYWTQFVKCIFIHNNLGRMERHECRRKHEPRHMEE